MHTRTATFSSIVVVCLLAPAGASAQTSLKALPVTLGPVAERSGPSVPGPSANPRTMPTQPPAPTPAASSGMKVAVYPILVWVPSFKVTTNVPPFPDVPSGPDLPGTGGSASTSTSLNGAALAGFSLATPKWRIDADGIWAGLGAQRDSPLLKVDMNVIYGHATAGVAIRKGLYVTGGFRRLALKFDAQLANRPTHFVRKPGLWDPLVGLGWHGELGSRWTVHAIGEGGGFGVGADVDLAASLRGDLKVARHVGLQLGYSLVYLKFSNTVLAHTLEVKTTMHGPTVGLGLYF